MASRAAVANALAEFPWAAEYLGVSTEPSSSSAGGVICDADEGPDAAPPEEGVVELWESLEAMATWDGVEEGHREFFVRLRETEEWVLGSAAPTKGVLAGEATKGAARDFCTRYAMNKSISFSIAAYGHADARKMCEEWCARMQYFFDAWRASGGDEGHVFSDEDIAAYRPSDAWAAFVATLIPGSSAHGRACTIAALAPSRPA